jgi:hypothetical protein
MKRRKRRASLLNRKATREFILKRIDEKRPGWNASSIDADTYQYLEKKLKDWIDDMVHRHPSKGKTFKAKYVVIGR